VENGASHTGDQQDRVEVRAGLVGGLVLTETRAWTEGSEHVLVRPENVGVRVSKSGISGQRVVVVTLLLCVPLLYDTGREALKHKLWDFYFGPYTLLFFLSKLSLFLFVFFKEMTVSFDKHNQ
jgi:hypothetical protein